MVSAHVKILANHTQWGLWGQREYFRILFFATDDSSSCDVMMQLLQQRQQSELVTKGVAQKRDLVVFIHSAQAKSHF